MRFVRGVERSGLSCIDFPSLPTSKLWVNFAQSTRKWKRMCSFEKSILYPHENEEFARKLTGGSYNFCNSSYSHISTASLLRIRLIWCDPYLAVKNFSRRSLTSPFSVKLTLKPCRPGDRSQSFIVSTPHCILNFRGFLLALFHLFSPSFMDGSVSPAESENK